MGSRTSGGISQTGKIKRVQEVLDLSETMIIKVLRGETKLPERVVLQTALEIYKRRVPAKTEKAEAIGDKLTVIKIVKNHLPDNPGTIVDVDPIEDRIAREASKIAAHKALKAEKTFEDPIGAEFINFESTDIPLD